MRRARSTGGLRIQDSAARRHTLPAIPLRRVTLRHVTLRHVTLHHALPHRARLAVEVSAEGVLSEAESGHPAAAAMPQVGAMAAVADEFDYSHFAGFCLDR